MTAPVGPDRVGTPGVVVAISATALRRVARDRLGLFFIVLLPFIVILLFGVGGGDEATGRLGVADDSGGVLAQRLLDRLADDTRLDVVAHDDRAALEEGLRRQRLAAGLVLPEGLEDAVAAGRGATLELLADPTGAMPEVVRAAVGAAVDEESAPLTAARTVADELGIPREEAKALAGSASATPPVAVEVGSVGGEAFTFGADESAANNLVLFVFITSLTGGAALIESRRLGTTRRMLASPASSMAVLGGEAAARFTVAGGQAIVVLAGASLLFGVRWGDPLGVAAVVVALALVGTGVSLLFGTLLDNADQAGAIAPPLGIALGMLGGALWPLEIVPEAMQRLALATPHAWAIAALRELSGRGGGIADVATELAVLVGFAVALLPLAAWRLRRSLDHG